MRDFRGLKVWQKAYHFTLEIYKVTRKFPREELYSLTSQTRRSAASIPANIAEGCGRSGAAELNRYLQIAMGSASELEFHILMAHDLGFLAHADFQALSQEVVDVKRMLTSFSQKLRMDCSILKTGL